LSIQIVIVHGAGHQIKLLAEGFTKPITNSDGTGITDAQTLDLAIIGANSVTHEILEGLSMNNLRGAHSNCVEAVPLGIIKGVDYQHTGKVHQIDTEMLKVLLEKGIIPVIPPLGFDGNGHTYRVNSDSVAVEIARALGAVKLMLITTRNGLEIDGKFISQVAVQELDHLLKTSADKLQPEMLSKAQHALRASQGGVPRVHVINGEVDEGLLAEVFSNEGIGTLIYANEYQGIRQAMRKDIRHIFALIKPSILGDQLLKRTRAAIEKHLNEYYVFEIDDNIVGCVSVVPYPHEKKAELACLQINPAHEHRGIGTKLAVRAELVAKDLGMETIFCLSTQAFTFFQHKLGYLEGTPDDLPPARREKYDQSGRNSKVMHKSLLTTSANGVPVREVAPAATT
jgi:amino-acid N-acetyltransferase